MGRTVAGLDEKRKKEEELQGILVWAWMRPRNETDRTAVVLAYEADVGSTCGGSEKHRESSARTQHGLASSTTS